MEYLIDKIIKNLEEIKTEEKKNIFQDRLNNIFLDTNEILKLINAIKVNNKDIILNYIEEKDNNNNIMKKLYPFYWVILNSIAE